MGIILSISLCLTYYRREATKASPEHQKLSGYDLDDTRR